MIKPRKRSPRRSLYDLALVEASKRKVNKKLALQHLEGALRAGDPRAAYALGTWYLYGKYVNRNVRRAFRLLKQAADEKLPDALYDVAVCYEKGVGTRLNQRKAVECYLRGALQGDAQSVYHVGRCLYHGIGAARDHRLAWAFLDRAKELGVSDRGRPSRRTEPSRR